MIEIPADALVVGLGGNVGGEPAIIDRFIRAREAIAQLGDVRSAPLYRTAPIGPEMERASERWRAGPVQAAFINSALRVKIAEAIPAEVMQTLLEIERLLGRDRHREARFGPRPIDLDILVWGTRVIRTVELEVPHPRLVERRFALQPIVDLFGEDVIVPGTTFTAGALTRRVGAQALDEISASW